jgi:transposase
MARGKRTKSKVLKAIVALYDAGMTGAEIADVFETPVGRRTIYDWLKTIKRERQRRKALEREREREKEQVTLSLKPEWQRGESAPRFQNVRRYRS